MSRVNLMVLVTAALLALAAGRAIAHGDENHSQDKKPAAAAKPAAAGALPAEATAAQRLPDGSLFVPKAVQRQLGLRHVVVEVGDLAATVEFNGKVIADPNAGGRIQATQSGRVEAGPKGLPTLGQKVTKGQVLAHLRPTASSLERGKQQAQLAEIDAQLAIAERKLTRYEQLEGVVSKAAIETARFEAGSLKKRRAAVAASIGAAEPLAAPVSGEIGAANVVVGQVVEAKEILFEVIDPARLAVEALAYDAALVEGIARASAPLPGGALELQFVGGGRQLREQAIPLLFRVLGPAPPPGRPKAGQSNTPEPQRGEQASPPREGRAGGVIPAPPPGRPKAGQSSQPEPRSGELASPPREGRAGGVIHLAVGQPLKVIAQTSRTVKGAALPQAAVVKVGAGETAVWVRDGAERFVLRRVGVAPLDATRVAVVKGIEEGERVLTEGAGLLAQVR